MKSSNLTLAIVTFKRSEKLRKCLESITKQTRLPGKVLVIDNDSGESAKKVVGEFKSELPLSYAIESKLGVPYARNYALKLCSTELIGFVDDDCVLDSRWVELGTKALKRKKTVYVLGKTILLNKDSVIAQAQHARHLRWFFYKFKGRQTGPFSVDTKNIIFLTKIIKNEEFLFDETLSINGYDSSDTDIGLQLEDAGYKGFYEAKMRVYHVETEEFLRFVKKAYYRGKLAAKISKKWRLKGEFVDLSEKNLLRWFLHTRFWPGDYGSYKKLIEGNFIRRLTLFLLVKAYDRIYLQGFLDERKS